MKKKYSLYILALLFTATACDNTTPTPTNETKEPVDISTACVLSQLVYLSHPENVIANYLPGWEIVWNPEKINSNYAFIATNKKSYVLVIRGSLMEISWHALDNWLYQDLHITSQKKWTHTIEESKAYIARGAYDGWQNILALKDKETDLIGFLKKNINAKKELVITGHSLGGNLATVTASWLYNMLQEKNKLPSRFNVITFAAPAAGNKEFAKDFLQKFPEAIRVENKNDLVPKFPIPSQVAALSDLYEWNPAKEINVRYKGFSVSLAKAFQLISLAINGIEIANGFSAYEHTKGKEKIITIPLSDTTKTANLQNWFSEAGYQHKISSYAAALEVPVINSH